MDVIEVSAVVVRDERGRVATVRKRGTDRFMLPGGKPEPGETRAQTAVRECAEELGVDLLIGDLLLLGTFESVAANEPGHRLHSTVFTHPPVPIDAPSGEIEELRWLDPSHDLPSDLAPMLTECVLPALGVGNR